MRNERGITLVELLLVIVIMSIVMSVVLGLIQYSLKSEQEVFVRNEMQREGRLIMEYITEKMRDGAKWELEGGNWKLCRDSCDEVYLIYEADERTIRTGENSILSNSVHTLIIQEEENLTTVSLVIEKRGRKLELNSEIINQKRF